jgi:hypothetical protein
MHPPVDICGSGARGRMTAGYGQPSEVSKSNASACGRTMISTRHPPQTSERCVKAQPDLAHIAPSHGCHDSYRTGSGSNGAETAVRLALAGGMAAR